MARVEPVDELSGCDVVFAVGQLIEQFGDVQPRTDFMIEVTEFLEGEITRIDLIVLRRENWQGQRALAPFDLPCRSVSRVL